MTGNRDSFGIAVLDERLRGPVRGGVHALIGGPGTGKTVAALQFLSQGVREGGCVAQLTQARPEDVIQLASSIGVDLPAHLRSRRWMLLGHQPGFRERYRRTLEPREVFDELRGFLTAEGDIDRLVIDTCGPLVESRETGNGAELLVEMLSDLRATALLTFAAENPGALDSAFDFLSQRASLILHLSLTSAGRREFVVRKTPGPMEPMGPISFDIRDGEGIVPPKLGQLQRATDVGPEVRRRVLLLDLSGELPEELSLWFAESFDLYAAADPVDAFPELARRDFGLVVVHVDRRSVERGLHVMHQLRRAASRPPILIVCGYDVRASDRARALRLGADDFISGGVNPEELASRIEALLRRGRASIDQEDGEAESPAPDGGPVLSDPEEFRAAIRSQLGAPGSPIFSLVLLRPTNAHGVDELASHVASQMRRGAGDRLSVVGETVEVFLNGALASHAEHFLKRVRTKPWTKVGSVVYTSPSDREELLEVIDQQHG